MNNTVLVTGAGGFVGSAVVRVFVQSMRDGALKFPDGAPVQQVIALLRPGGSRERLEALAEAEHWSVEYADMTDRPALRALLDRIQPRAILHLAVDQAIHRDLPEAERYRLNIAPLETLFEGLRGAAGARLIHTSSAWVLEAGERLDESAKVEPRVAYAENKVRAEQLLPIMEEKTGVRWINLRLFYIFGKYEQPMRLLPYLVSRLTEGKIAELSSGERIRDFSDVEDIARAYLMALQADESACGRVFHIGSGRGITVRDFAMTVADMTGNADLIRFGVKATQDQYLACQVADPTRAQRVLRWFPGGDLRAQIRTTVEWWLDRRRAADAVIGTK